MTEGDDGFPLVNDRSQCAKFRGNPPKELRTAHSSRSKLGPLMGQSPSNQF